MRSAFSTYNFPLLFPRSNMVTYPRTSGSCRYLSTILSNRTHSLKVTDTALHLPLCETKMRTRTVALNKDILGFRDVKKKKKFYIQLTLVLPSGVTFDIVVTERSNFSVFALFSVIVSFGVVASLTYFDQMS